ncbi:MAG TPA: twin-arginine translocase subunit TatC [Candidatus Hydrogenedentes bacterium]|nr:twin-arginine translocase subunit TatC [Candidatus Hydrogenedentota bacterium]HPG66801.1 twin-arginine translocase subunit TatC [Candidatus Hydrogenedentota bacterium]
MSDDEARMTFTEHLGELRTRIVRAGVALVIGFVVCYALSNQIFAYVRWPLRALEDAWVALSPIEPVLVKLKIAGYGGALLMSPYILYQACAFVFPGLTRKERSVVRVLLFGGAALSVLGVAVAYWGILPLVLPYLIEKLTPDGVVNQLRLNETLSFIVKVLAGFAIAFQFPMAVLVLVYMDLLTPDTLKRYRRVAIVGLAVASAVLTPPDPGSMIIMLIPLLLLYEGSIWASYLVVRKKKALPDPADKQTG